MKDSKKMTVDERAFYFEQASGRLDLPPAAIEKDFWVTWVLGRLFSSSALASKILFKGGTSLSKVFGLIERFSEDIDLILDWNEVVSEDPNMERSKTKQDQFNKAVPERSREYIERVLLPEVLHLMGGICSAEIETGAPDVINIRYPSKFAAEYLRPEIRLEIGPLAQWVPHARYAVTSYVADAFPDLFEQPACHVIAIKAERTFWEKATILHHEAHRPESSEIPARYSRHYYDLYMMAANASLKQIALSDLELLKSVVAFKMKFYPRGWARYDLAKPDTLRLVPTDRRLAELRSDYDAMKEMIFGKAVDFDEIVAGLKALESEINA
jgi:hypothetical protein